MKTGVIGGKRPNSASHGGGIRGDQLGTRSSLYEGRFGRMFRSLPPAQWSREALFNLGQAMTADPETAENDPTLPAAALEDPAERIHDDEENTGIAAGYTYFGQFIDHDITFDPASSLQQQNDPEALVDFRTPRLDLDSVYGRGPADQPYLYAGRKFRLGRPLFELDQPTHVRDLPRYDEQSGGSAETRADRRQAQRRERHRLAVPCRDPPVPQQAGRRPPDRLVRGCPAAGALALPVAGDQRLPAHHLRRRRGRRAAAAPWQQAPRVGEESAAAVLQVEERAVHADRVLRGRLSLRPFDGPADLPSQHAAERRRRSPDAHAGRNRPRPGGPVLHLCRRPRAGAQRIRQLPAAVGDRLEPVLRHQRIAEEHRHETRPAGLQDRHVPREPARDSCRSSRGSCPARRR